MEILEQIQVSPEILGGTPVFRGTRVPVQSLFWHLEKGIGIDDFLEDFPSVRREQIINVLKNLVQKINGALESSLQIGVIEIREN